MSSIQIKYVARVDIDIEKWDELISNSPDGLIYAHSYYLDAMAENWDALVLNDYEAVMPLTWRKKLGIKYLYQPAFTQQLGIFSIAALSANIQNAFVLTAKQQFSFAEIFVNFQYNEEATAHNNFVLPLNQTYQAISSRYKQDLKKNIKRTNTFKLQYRKNFAYQTIIKHYINAYAERLPNILLKDYESWSLLCDQHQQQLITRAVTDENNETIAMLLCIKDKQRMYLIMCVTLPEGRKKVATHFLIDQLIKEFSNQDLVLDFEGSDIEGIAHFYKNFGSINQPYYFLKWNQLPSFIKWLKD